MCAERNFNLRFKIKLIHVIGGGADCKVKEVTLASEKKKKLMFLSIAE